MVDLLVIVRGMMQISLISLTQGHNDRYPHRPDLPVISWRPSARAASWW